MKQKVNNEIKTVNQQINTYRDKVHLNQRKSFYEQQEILLIEYKKRGIYA